MNKSSMIPSAGKAISVILAHFSVVDFVRDLSVELSECLFCGSAVAIHWPPQPHRPVSPKGNPSPADGRLKGCSCRQSGKNTSAHPVHGTVACSSVLRGRSRPLEIPPCAGTLLTLPSTELAAHGASQTPQGACESPQCHSCRSHTSLKD